MFPRSIGVLKVVSVGEGAFASIGSECSSLRTFVRAWLGGLEAFLPAVVSLEPFAVNLIRPAFSSAT